MKRRGATLIEIVFASALLLVVTGVLMQSLTSVMRSARPLDERQDNLQKLVVFREDLIRRLAAGKVRKVAATAVEMYFPEAVPTSVGPLPRIDESEMVLWDETRVVEILKEPGGTVVERVRGGPASARRVLWNLGAEGALVFDASHLPLVAVTVRTGAVPDRWERTFHVVLDQFFEDAAH